MKVRNKHFHLIPIEECSSVSVVEVTLSERIVWCEL